MQDRLHKKPGVVKLITFQQTTQCPYIPVSKYTIPFNIYLANMFDL